MEIPEEVQKLVDELGETVVASLLSDARTRAITQEIQELGFNLALAVEASISLTPREEEQGDLRDLEDWSEEDRAFLQTFHIKLNE